MKKGNILKTLALFFIAFTLGLTASVQANIQNISEKDSKSTTNTKTLTSELSATQEQFIDKKTGVTIPVLMYHHLVKDDSYEINNMIVTADKFKSDMITLKEAGYEAIFASELVGYLNGLNPLPNKPIIITFDDGYRSNYEFAYPVAKETQTKITIAMIGWSVGRKTFITSDKPINPHFSWDEAKEMVDSDFVDIQNHTFDLHSPEGLSYGYEVDAGYGVLPIKEESYASYKTRLLDDILKMNQEIYIHTKNVSTFVFYPYGQYDEDTEKILTLAGIDGTFLAIPGIRTFKSVQDLRKIPRLNVTNDLVGELLLEAIDNLEHK